MKIYTSYFANIKNLPDTMTPVSICAKAPAGYTGWQYRKLAPTYETLMDYKSGHDKDRYVKSFKETVLDALNPVKVVEELSVYGQGKDIVLICYEKPDDFCHRHLVAEWITRNTDYTVKEY